LWMAAVAICLGTYGGPRGWLFLMSEVPLYEDWSLIISQAMGIDAVLLGPCSRPMPRELW